MADLFQIIKGYKRDLRVLHRKSCLEFYNLVVESTPVDKGRARQGWQIESPPIVGKTFRGVNNVEYISFLEHGHSDQAPKGMVRANAPKWPNIVRGNL